VIDYISLSLQVGRHSGPAIERRPQILLVNQPHQVQIELGFSRRSVVIGRPVESEQLALTAHADLLIVWLDQFAFGFTGKGLSFFSAIQAPS
jgi:hypothetical protein